MLPSSTRTAEILPAAKTLRSFAETFYMPYSPLRRSTRKMIPLVEQPVMSMLTLLSFATGHKQRILETFNKSVATANTTHQEYTCQGAPTYPYFSKPLEMCIYIHASVPPIPFWSCLHQENTFFFWIYKTV